LSKDIKIIGNNLVMQNGDFVLVDKIDKILQQCRVGLQILIGEWVLDYRKGINYPAGLKKNTNILKAQIKNALLDVEGIDQVLNYVFDTSTTTYRVSATLVIGNQEILLNEDFSI
jgi:hypothetical protein